MTAELKNANSGFSKWGFATKNGKKYFIKELITPVYPVDRDAMTDELFELCRTSCIQYENRTKRLLNKINSVSHGNLIRIEEFFRCDSRYYLITEKVEEAVNTEHITALDEERKLLLLKTVARCFYDLHSAGIVHLDVKPQNIIVKKTKSNNHIAKLIDFDSGFFIGEQPEREALGGDLTYLAPETFLAMSGETVCIDDKADIFALGLVFHEYYCGELPWFDNTEYEYPYEAVLDKGVLMPQMAKMPENISRLIISMLDLDPAKRPSAKEICKQLSKPMNDNEVLEIEHLGIHFNGHYGKSIGVSKNSIKYRNTIHPTIVTKTRNFPESYFAQKEKIITPEQFDEIIDKITESGLFDIITPRNDKEVLYTGAVYQVLTVVFESGVTYEYSTHSEPNGQFQKIADILSKYCDFPKINPEWYNTTVKQNDEFNQTDTNWFKPAGDL